jgi:Zn-dependent peptidase ImmA (M78 family)
LGTTLHELLREHHTGGNVSPRFRAGLGSGDGNAARASATGILTRLAQKYVELEYVHGIERPPALLESIATYHVTKHPGLDPKLAGMDAALTVRNALDLGDNPATSLDERFAIKAGFRIFCPVLPLGIDALFFWTDELGACVAVNRNQPHERRRWSLSHEVGHFLRDREAGDILPTGGPARMDSSEIFSDAFTMEFLMPRAGVSKQFVDRFRANGSAFSIADIIAMSHFYEVSFQAMTLRLEDLRLIPSGFYEGLKRRNFKARDARAKLGVPPPPPAPSVFPDRYLTLAFQAYEKELISESELADYLEVDRVSARGEYLAARTQIIADGKDVELDLAQSVAAE